MGPRRGGGKSFLKAARAGKADAADDAHDHDAAPEQAPAPAPQPSSQPASKNKADAFLKQPEASADDSSSGDDAEKGGETRGKEQKILKEQVKRLGKKGKDEAAKLEAEMESRHAAELAALAGERKQTAAEIVAVADSLYTVHLSGEQDSEQQQKKPSKSQKRRDQRQREEAEREARIQAELAEAGDTARAIEERELQTILAPLGLSVHAIPPDGHCLYRALEDQLQRLPAEVAPPPAAAELEVGEELSFLVLRQKAAEYMRQHADEFKPFVLEEDATASSGSDDSFEAYCTELESTAAWGGQVELQALSHALQSHIAVYCADMPLVELGEEHKGTGRTLRLCYLRHAYGLGEHYESVVPGLGQVDEDDAAAAEQDDAPAAADVAAA